MEGRSNAEAVRPQAAVKYNERYTWLANAHTILDAAVFDAYGWPTDLPDQEILARLLALNLQREPA